MNPPTPVSPDELLRLFDGELSDAEMPSVQARLSEQDRHTLAAWKQQQDQLLALGASIANEPTPVELLQATHRASAAHASLRQWQRWGGLAASVVLAFGSGWLARGWDGQSQVAQMVATAMPAGLIRADFSAQAALAHATFTPEVKHPVEVSAEQQAHLVQWLSKRLGRELQVPDLTTQGYRLMGGRLLPGESGARAQFMYQRSDGLRVTLYVGAAPQTPAPSAQSQDTAFAFSRHAQVSNFYWVDQGFGYALSAQLSQAELLSLAQAVHPQL